MSATEVDLGDNPRLLAFKDLAAYGIFYHYTHVRRLVLAGRFPAPIKLGTSERSRNAWLKSDIEKWIKLRIATDIGAAA